MDKRSWIAGLCVLAMGCAGSCSPGDGEATGTVIALRHHGMLRATYEAEFVKGGMANGSGVTGVGAFWVTVDNDSLLPLVQLAADSSYEVRYRYHSESLCTPLRSESGCDFLTGIEPLPRTARAPR